MKHEKDTIRQPIVVPLEKKERREFEIHLMELGNGEYILEDYIKEHDLVKIHLLNKLVTLILIHKSSSKKQTKPNETSFVSLWNMCSTSIKDPRLQLHIMTKILLNVLNPS